MINQEVEILIVEDSMEDAELAIRALKKNHLANTIVHLTDGTLALDFIFGRGEYADRNTHALPKVILLDLKMPKVNGKEVLQQIKSSPATRSIPVVILTSSAEDPDIKHCYELGANSYIVKPVEFENFCKTVSELGMYWMVLNRLKP
ncbi:MAG TPA: response regulator [Cyclobacteriaceae bacterium]|nr:response regulator [Cyclobacteriaceae bacterium]